LVEVGGHLTVLGYRDQLGFGIVADREQLDDPWRLLAAARDALAELYALVPTDSTALEVAVPRSRR
jgi:hypothetical protein